MAAPLVVTVDGKVCALDFDSVTSREWKQIGPHTGLTPRAFFDVIAAGSWPSVEVTDAIRWLFLRRAGEEAPLAACDDYPLSEFLLAYFEAVTKANETAKAAEAGETAGSAPKSSGRAKGAKRPDSKPAPPATLPL